MLGDLGIGRGTAELGLELLKRLVELAGLAADEPRHPVHRAKLVEHGTTDSRHAVRLELHAPRHIEGVDGVHQPKRAGRDEVVELDAVGKA